MRRGTYLHHSFVYPSLTLTHTRPPPLDPHFAPLLLGVHYFPLIWRVSFTMRLHSTIHRGNCHIPYPVFFHSSVIPCLLSRDFFIATRPTEAIYRYNIHHYSTPLSQHMSRSFPPPFPIVYTRDVLFQWNFTSPFTNPSTYSCTHPSPNTLIFVFLWSLFHAGL